MAASNAAAKAGAKPNAKAAAAPPAPKKRGPWLYICLAMPLALVLLPSTLVMLAAMVPTLVARIVDPAPGRQLTVTVGSLNFAGALWFMHDLWSAGQSFSAIMPTLSDMIGWLAALVGAGMGWALYSLMPIVTRSIATTKSNLRLSRLRKSQEALVEEWGDPVRGGLTLPTTTPGP
ncbi:hypothetical protein [Dongia sp.]|uniref:hypothetical protein n=1 Tax=Dongia sp. TaxID=1977262 RepID=UPI0037504998